MYSQLELCRAVTNKNLFIDINRFLGVTEYASNTVAYEMIKHAKVENGITYTAIEDVDGVTFSSFQFMPDVLSTYVDCPIVESRHRLG